MKIYSAERGVGRTTALIKESAKTGAIIVAASYPMVDYIACLAKRLGLDISEWRAELEENQRENT